MNAKSMDRGVGVIGLGLMGSALADRLHAQGFLVVVWNRSAAKTERFAKAGVPVAASVADAALASDIIIVCLIDHAATMAAVAKRAVADALKGKVLIQLTTMTSDESRALAAWSGTHGIDYLEGQILDYPDDVRSGESTIPSAGPKRVFESCRSILEALAARAPHLSETLGAAALLDKALFEVGFPAYIGFLHGAAMCQAVGVPIEVYADLVIAAYFKSKVVEQELGELAERIKATSYAEGVKAALSTYQAAFAKTLSESEAMGLESGHLRAVDAIFKRAIAAGHGDHDFAAVFETLKKGSA